MRRGRRRLGVESLEDRRLLAADPLAGAEWTASLAPGNGASFGPALSGDGRYAAFVSAATNLVPGDTNGADDIFVSDLTTGVVRRVSTSAAAVEANGASRNPSISADGRYVAFESDATNLVPGDINNSTDVFVKDLLTGAIQRASTDRTGSEAGGVAFDPSLSSDGRWVAFTSTAENLVPGDTNNDLDVFVKDLQTGAIVRASVDEAGQQGNDDSSHARLSGNGRFVAFESVATNLAAGDRNKCADVFVKDLQTGAVTLASADLRGTQGNLASSGASITDDGRYVSFSSFADNLVPADTNALGDVFVKDLQTGSIVRANTDWNGNQANSNSADATISPGGGYVAFVTAANNLVAHDTNASADVFVKNLRTGSIVRANTTGEGRQSSGTTWSLGTPRLSSDGRSVAFSTDAGNLVPGDTNGLADVLVKNLDSGAIVLASGSTTTAHQSTLGLYDPVASVWYLNNSLTSGLADATFGFGAPGAGWRPVTGDWDGDGVDTVGLYDQGASLFYLRNSNTTGPADLAVAFGVPGAGWIPVAGDWNGDGLDTVGLYDPVGSVFYLRNTNSGGAAQVIVPFGPPGGGWRPVAGDWNGTGRDSVGLYNAAASAWYLSDSLTAAANIRAFGFGVPAAGWTPVTGDWNLDRVDSAGLYDPLAAVWHTIDAQGQSASVVAFGSPGNGWIPVTGDWDGQGNLAPVAATSADSPVSSLKASAVDQIDLAALAEQQLQNSLALDLPAS